jgi:hypothetical protein
MDNDTLASVKSATFMDKFRYTGTIDADGLPHGVGSLHARTEDGEPDDVLCYAGHFEHGVMQGCGERRFCSGKVQIGRFVDNILQGSGLEIQPDGTVFWGRFYKNVRYGHGILLKTDGLKHFGEFRFGLPYGEAVQVKDGVGTLRGYLQGQFSGHTNRGAMRVFNAFSFNIFE